MHKRHSLTAARLRRVVKEKIRPRVRPESVPLEIAAWRAPGEPPTVTQALAAEYSEVDHGSEWGIPWATTWFKFSGDVPQGWLGKTVEATLDLGFSNLTGFQAEGLIWVQDETDDWVPWKGLHPLNHRIIVAEGDDLPNTVEIFVEAASNPTLVDHRPDPNSDITTSLKVPLYRLGAIQINVFEPTIEALLLDYEVLASHLEQVGPNEPRGAQISVALERSLDVLDIEDILGTVEAARAELAGVLGTPAEASAHKVSAIGHAHIDTAWLWPLRETKRKCSRTFSNVLRLMEEYPDFKFVCSQAVQYQWMKDEFPTIFEAISERIEEGRWFTTGGMWVESDTNLPSGESLIRQFLYGQQFFLDNFGHRDTEVWIPDVFGYPASLPQIMQLCGFERFLTQKLSWNKTNRFPHNTFNWEGIDGSTVLTHFPSVETYNAQFSGFELAHTVEAYKDHGATNRSLMPFGFGDGGGGPTKKMMERFERLKDFEGSPKLEIESPAEFFDKLSADYENPPRWVGELYFEMHRGTFTSQAKTKLGNRRCETLLAEAELWNTAAFGTQSAGGYPTADMANLWREVLTQQFHDILPGSSIGWVHREAEETFARVADELEELISVALDELAPNGQVSVANGSPSDFDEVVVVSDPATTTQVLVESDEESCQQLADGTVALRAKVAAHSLAPLQALSPAGSVSVSSGAIDNGIVRVEFDDRGLINSIHDYRNDREVIASGEFANRLALHPDFPNEYDAWDLDEFYRSQVSYVDDLANVEVLDDGPLMARVKIERSFGSSTIEQIVSMRAGSARIDIDTYVDWQEREKVLKAEFPVAVHATEVTREIQFGNVKTPIHENTTWDTARFEVCAHRWIDVSEHGYGVALLNDSKYGHDISRARTAAGESAAVMRITLLRGSNYPDPTADQGVHRFRYSLLPHPGTLADGDVVAEGYRMNNELRFVTKMGTQVAEENTSISVVTSDNPSVVIETIKPANDDSGDLIIRGYEAHGGRAEANLSFGFGVAELIQVDALETRDFVAPCGLGGNENNATVSLNPFQIFTLRITPG